MFTVGRDDPARRNPSELHDLSRRGNVVQMILRFGAPRSYPRASSLSLTGNSPYRALRDDVCNSEDDGAQFGGEAAGCGQEVNCGKAAREAALECPALHVIFMVYIAQ